MYNTTMDAIRLPTGCGRDVSRPYRHTAFGNPSPALTFPRRGNTRLTGGGGGTTTPPVKGRQQHAPRRGATINAGVCAAYCVVAPLRGACPLTSSHRGSRRSSSAPGYACFVPTGQCGTTFTKIVDYFCIFIVSPNNLIANLSKLTLNSRKDEDECR